MGHDGFKWYPQYVSNIAIVQGAIDNVIVLLLWLYRSESPSSLAPN